MTSLNGTLDSNEREERFNSTGDRRDLVIEKSGKRPWLDLTNVSVQRALFMAGVCGSLART